MIILFCLGVKVAFQISKKTKQTKKKLLISELNSEPTLFSSWDNDWIQQLSTMKKMLLLHPVQEMAALCLYEFDDSFWGVMLKPSLCVPVLNWISETEFWVNWERRALYCFAQQRRPQQASTHKTVPPWSGQRGSYSVKATGHDQLLGILLNGWWWGYWESASSAFWFQSVWGLHACGQHTISSSPRWRFLYLQNSSKDWAENIIDSPWGRNKVSWPV